MKNLKKKLAYKTQLPRHLAELSQLLGRRVRATELLSIDDTSEILDRAKGIQRVPAWRCEIRFSEKSGERFRGLIGALHEAYAERVYVWTPLGGICGLPHLVSLTAIDFGFSFEVNPEGILSILTSDLTQKMLLDYTRNEHGEQTLEVEVSGSHWGTTRY